MSARPDPLHPLAKICPIEHDPERNRMQRAVLDAALSYYLIGQRWDAFFTDAQGAFSGVYPDPQAKAQELDAKMLVARDKLMDACEKLMQIAPLKKARRA